MKPLTDPEMQSLIYLHNKVVTSKLGPREIAKQLQEEGNVLFGMIATLFGGERAVSFARTIADSIENNKERYEALTQGYYMQEEVIGDIAALPTTQPQVSVEAIPPKPPERGPYL